MKCGSANGIAELEDMCESRKDSKGRDSKD